MPSTRRYDWPSDGARKPVLTAPRTTKRGSQAAVAPSACRRRCCRSRCSARSGRRGRGAARSVTSPFDVDVGRHAVARRVHLVRRTEAGEHLRARSAARRAELVGRRRRLRTSPARRRRSGSSRGELRAERHVQRAGQADVERAAHVDVADELVEAQSRPRRTRSCSAEWSGRARRSGCRATSKSKLLWPYCAAGVPEPSGAVARARQPSPDASMIVGSISGRNPERVDLRPVARVEAAAVEAAVLAVARLQPPNA